MDCSLVTWPSITQFDDFSWAGLGDIDPLETLDRSLDTGTGPSPPASPESKPSVPASSIPCCDAPPPIPPTQSTDLYRLTSSESLIAARWESINSVDLAAVLDSAFPSNGDTSTPSAEDVYDIYTDNVLNDVDTLMSDSVSEVADDNAPFYPLDDAPLDVNLVTPEVAALPCPLKDVECGNGAIDGESPRSINTAHVGTPKPVEIRRGCNASAPDIFDSRVGVRANMVQSLPFSSVQPSTSGDPCTSSQCVMDLKEPMLPLRAGYMVPWWKAQFTSANPQVFEREKVMHPSSLRYGDNYPAILDQQVMMADAASVELKRNQAQASRARRVAANQRRAKKYPLQKLIRMSSSPTSTRDKVEQNVDGSLPMMHQPVHMVMPSQYSGGVQSLPRNALATSLVPVLQSPHATSSLEALSQANSAQGVPYSGYQQKLMARSEENQVSSGSGAKQSMCTDQDAQSLSSTPTTAFSYSECLPEGLDAALLEQFQTILGKMNVKVRLCIRDALYRLADSAKHRQCKNDTASDSSSSISKEAMETNTNSLDRWIVNILFCKQPSSFNSNSEMHPTDSTQVPYQLMQAFNTSSSSQHWNSCGSSVNLQEQPLHVLTGL